MARWVIALMPPLQPMFNLLKDAVIDYDVSIFLKIRNLKARNNVTYVVAAALTMNRFIMAYMQLLVPERLAVSLKI